MKVKRETVQVEKKHVRLSFVQGKVKSIEIPIRGMWRLFPVKRAKETQERLTEAFECLREYQEGALQ